MLANNADMMGWPSREPTTMWGWHNVLCVCVVCLCDCDGQDNTGARYFTSPIAQLSWANWRHKRTMICFFMQAKVIRAALNRVVIATVLWMPHLYDCLIWIGRYIVIFDWYVRRVLGCESHPYPSVPYAPHCSHPTKNTARMYATLQPTGQFVQRFLKMPNGPSNHHQINT